MIRNAKRDALGTLLSPIWERLSDDSKKILIAQHEAAVQAASALNMALQFSSLSPQARLDIIKPFGNGTLTEDDLLQAVKIEVQLKQLKAVAPPENRQAMHFPGLKFGPDSDSGPSR